MIKKSLLFAILLFTSAAYAEPVKIVVQKLIGEVQYEGKPLHENDQLTQNGLLETKDKAFVKIFAEKWDSAIILGPNSSMQLDLLSPPGSSTKRYTLDDGQCRWISGKNHPPIKGGMQVFTKSASFGVRGTDFFIKHNKSNDESEIVVFDGKVLFHSNLARRNSEVMVNTGQWGGVGGHYGKKITKLRTLTEADMEKLKAGIEF